MYYRKKPAKNQLNEDGEAWPPRYWKASITMDDDSEFAFMDSRRLGRIKMIDAEDITSVPPLSLLGEYVVSHVESRTDSLIRR